MNLFDTLKSYLDAERLVATATVMGVPEGSAVEVGAKIIVLPDGEVTGTLGDAALEAAIVADAVR
ncbi:MAG: XdhC family protein, partial [Thermomicrobiales bacterium]